MEEDADAVEVEVESTGIEEPMTAAPVADIPLSGRIAPPPATLPVMILGAAAAAPGSLAAAEGADPIAIVDAEASIRAAAPPPPPTR